MGKTLYSDEQFIEFIQNFRMTHAYGPTIREIRAALGIRSNWAVQTRLDKLERAGRIRRDGRAARTLDVVK